MTTSKNVSDTATWDSRAEAIEWNIRPFIDGHYHESATDDTYSTINPATETPLCDAPVGDSSDVDRAVASARQCVSSRRWSAQSPAQRGEFLLRLGDLMVEHKDELALYDSLEMGRPIQAALWDVETFSTVLLKSWAHAVGQMVGESLPLTPFTAAFNTREPRGVVAAITAWNFPVVNAIIKIGPALAAGNAVVLKPSELSPSSALKIAELALEAGLPPGALNVVPGIGSTVGQALASHTDIDFLGFTGSTATAKRIMKSAAQSKATPLLLECGGKSPQVVFGDADNLDFVAETILQEALDNQGQVCVSQSRIIVERQIKDDLLQRLVKGAEHYRPAPPLDEATTFGPLASPAQRDRVKKYIQLGKDANAVTALEGTVRDAGGCYVSPTIFDQVTMEMPIAREEIFGPVLSVLTFESEEEAVAMANSTDYGLNATVWTRDTGRAKRTAGAIRAGTVIVRTSGEEDPEAALGSYFILGSEPQKVSGFGAEMGSKGIESYSTLKAIYLTGG